jgi:predicted nucleic acid-binding protein
LKHLVIDASLTVAWMLEEAPPLALRAMHLIQSGTIAVVPDLWYYEVCNSLITAERKGRAAEQVVTALVADVERLAEFLEASPTTPSLLVTAARQSGLTAYDAAYWELARRRRLPLATLDAQMRTAAQKAGIEILK